jgi:hypothetical protein
MRSVRLPSRFALEYIVMGTERTVCHRQPCKCGKGEFVVELLEPYHPYARPSQRQWEPSIQCPKCSKTFSLIEQNREIILVYNSELEEKKRYRDQYVEQSNALMQIGRVRSYLQQFEQLLSSQRSVAAVYRLLLANQFVDKSEGAFRREFSIGPSKWIEWHIQADDLPKILKVLGKPDDRLFEEVAQIRKLWEQGSEPLTAIEPRIYKIRH